MLSLLFILSILHGKLHLSNAWITYQNSGTQVLSYLHHWFLFIATNKKLNFHLLYDQFIPLIDF